MAYDEHEPPTTRELLARLDERTERLDRDIRQVILGQNARAEEMERRMEAFTTAFRDDLRSIEVVVSQNNKMAESAKTMAEKHDEWLTWAVRIVIGAVILAALTLIGVSV